MNKNILEELVNQNLSSREIAKRLDMSQTNIRYWLKKFNLTTIKKSKDDLCKVCLICNINKSKAEFYTLANSKTFSYCISCERKRAIQRQQDFKIACVKYKGGKCIYCGYNKSFAALDFHHLDPNQKDFGIAQVKKLILNNEIKNELDKCILLCANCHREEHFKQSMRSTN